MAGQKRVRYDDTVDGFLDLEAVVDDGGEEQWDEEEDEDDITFIDNSETTSSPLAKGQVRGDAITPNSNVAAELAAVGDYIRRKYAECRYSTPNPESADVFEQSSVYDTWMFRYPRGDCSTLEARLRGIEMQPHIPSLFRLPVLPRTFFLKLTAAGRLKLLDDFTPYPIIGLTPIPREQFNEYEGYLKARVKEPIAWKELARITTSTGPGALYKGDLGRLYAVDSNNPADTILDSSDLASVLRLNHSQSSDEDMALMLVAPRLNLMHGQKRVRGGKRMRPPRSPINIAQALETKLVTPYTKLSCYQLMNSPVDVLFTKEGMLLLKVPFRDLEKVLLPQLDELKYLDVPEYDDNFHDEKEMGLKASWQPGVKVLAVAGPLKGVSGRTLSHMDSERASIDVLFSSFEDPVSVSASDVRYAPEPGDNVRVMWGPHSGVTGLVSSLVSRTAVINVKGTEMVECWTCCLLPAGGALVASSNARASPFISQTGYVVRGPHKGVVGTITGVQDASAAIRNERIAYQGYVNRPDTINPDILLPNSVEQLTSDLASSTPRDLVCTILAKNHRPALVQVKQRDVLVHGSNYRTMTGDTLPNFYTSVRYMTSEGCKMEDILWDPSQELDKILLQRRPAATLDVPLMFTSESDAAHNSTRRSLVGENCYVVRGEKKGILSRIREVGHDTVTIEGSGVIASTWVVKKSQLVALDRSITRTMDGQKLMSPLNRSEILQPRDHRPLIRAATPPPLPLPTSSGTSADSAVWKTSGGAHNAEFLFDSDICRALSEQRFRARVLILRRTDTIGKVAVGRAWDPVKKFAPTNSVWVDYKVSGTDKNEGFPVTELQPAKPKKNKETVLIIAGPHAGRIVETFKMIKKDKTIKTIIDEHEHTLPWTYICPLEPYESR